jgi:hypothetical protein
VEIVCGLLDASIHATLVNIKFVMEREKERERAALWSMMVIRTGGLMAGGGGGGR